jgi:hypothetical protein
MTISPVNCRPSLAPSSITHRRVSYVAARKDSARGGNQSKFRHPFKDSPLASSHTRRPGSVRRMHCAHLWPSTAGSSLDSLGDRQTRPTAVQRCTYNRCDTCQDAREDTLQLFIEHAREAMKDVTMRQPARLDTACRHLAICVIQRAIRDLPCVSVWIADVGPMV